MLAHGPDGMVSFGLRFLAMDLRLGLDLVLALAFALALALTVTVTGMGTATGFEILVGYGFLAVNICLVLWSFF